ncbi:MAG TPA: alpha/beta hydrolase [Longimicrobiales bacterium]|nr:alpha/beta hydrolase [Longimicrobiales bacterium]
MKRFLLATALVVIVLIAILLAVFGLHRGRTHAIRNRTLRIVPNSIARLQPMQIGGAKQWVLIRGRSRNNPIVLFLHGGPGAATMYLAHRFQRPLESEFVMVQWDRRGAGKSYDARIPEDSLTLRRELDDTYELTKWLRREFKQDRIYLVGHSWGSTVGMMAVREHPEYYRAFVGVGQMAADSLKEREVQRAWLLKAAFESNDRELIDRVRAYGDITETDIFRHRGQLHTHKSFLPLLAASFRSPEYTWSDIFHIRAGHDFMREHMRNNVTRGSLQSTVTEVSVPVFFFLGAYDYLTPSTLAIEYFRKLKAPYKRVVWFPNSAHYAFFEERERFAAAMHDVHLSVTALQH